MVMKLTKHILMLTLLAGGLVACNDDDDDIYVPPAANSYLFAIQPEDWADFEDSEGVVGFETEFEIPALTPEINDGGAVLVYFDFNGDGVFNALPHVYDNITYLFNTYVESIQFQILGAEAGIAPSLPATIDCKVVLIDGVLLKAHPDKNPMEMSLQEVERTFQVR